MKNTCSSPLATLMTISKFFFKLTLHRVRFRFAWRRPIRPHFRSYADNIDIILVFASLKKTAPLTSLASLSEFLCSPPTPRTGKTKQTAVCRRVIRLHDTTHFNQSRKQHVRARAPDIFFSAAGDNFAPCRCTQLANTARYVSMYLRKPASVGTPSQTPFPALATA